MHLLAALACAPTTERTTWTTGSVTLAIDGVAATEIAASLRHDSHTDRYTLHGEGAGTLAGCYDRLTLGASWSEGEDTLSLSIDAPDEAIEAGAAAPWTGTNLAGASSTDVEVDVGDDADCGAVDGTAAVALTWAFDAASATTEELRLLRI